MAAAVSFMGSVRPSGVVLGFLWRRSRFVRVVEHVGELVGLGVVPEEGFEDGVEEDAVVVDSDVDDAGGA